MSLCHHLVPNEIDSTISVDPVNSYNEVGSKITFTCSIVYHKPSYIDINTGIYVEWIHGRSILNTTTNLADYSFKFTIDILKLSDAGQYNCSYHIFPTISNPNIQNSKRQFSSTSISAISKS